MNRVDSEDQEAETYWHGTNAGLEPGDLLEAGRPSNYRPEIVMRHIYFTALKDGAGLAAQLAVLLHGGSAHVYQVAPTGEIEDDPNVTDRKFPGNPTRSYRSRAPLRIIREDDDWTRLDADQLAAWQERLDGLRQSQAEIIN